MIQKNGVVIRILEDWEKTAPPKHSNQWKANRSAMELARAWLPCVSPCFPQEVAQVLANHAEFGLIQQWTAEPEAKFSFDGLGGEPRNSDLAVEAVDQYGRFLIAVEGKADEPFGDTVGGTLASALERQLKDERSKGITRVQLLVRALFEERHAEEPSLNHIRYQLMTACAGAMCEGERRRVGRVVLLIHEFSTELTHDGKHELNARDLDNFVVRLTRGVVKSVEVGLLYGPFSLPGDPLFSNNTKLFIGKAARYLRKPANLS